MPFTFKTVARGEPRAYLIECSTFGRAPLFDSRELVTLVSTQFLKSARRCECEILAYGFDRAVSRLLVETAHDCSAFAGESRFVSGCVYASRYGGVLWARDYELRSLTALDAADAAAGIAASAVSGSFAWHRLARINRSADQQINN